MSLRTAARRALVARRLFASSARLTGTAATADGAALAWAMHRPAAASTAPPLVVVSGWSGAVSDWGGLLSALAHTGKRDVVAFSHRGMGASTLGSDAKPTMATFADDVSAVMRDANVADRAPHLLGVSMGGCAVQLVALDSGIELSSLTLGCTTHGGKTSVPPPSVAFFGAFKAWRDGDAAARRACAEAFVLPGLPEAWQQEGSAHRKLASTFVEGFLETERDADGLDRQLGALMRFSNAKRLAALADLPVHTITGDEDAVVPMGNSALMAAALRPGGEDGALLRQTVRTGTGHLFWLVDPLDVVDDIAGFLADVDAQ